MIAFFERAVSGATATATPLEIWRRIEEGALWTESMAALSDLAALSLRNGFDVVLVAFPVLVDFDSYPFEPLHAALGERARELGFGFVDLLAEYRSRVSASDIDTDVIHPNARGHAIAAEALTAHILERGVRARGPR